MKYAIWGFVLLLLILHQDNWNWENGKLMFGFMPVGLFYHACISLAATVIWFMATKFIWPTELQHEKDSRGTH